MNCLIFLIVGVIAVVGLGAIVALLMSNDDDNDDWPSGCVV